MAKLPVYQSDRSIGTGAEFMRAQSPNTDVAKGMVSLGNAITGFGAARAREEEQEANKLQVQAAKDDNLRLTADALDYGSTLRDRALTDEETLGPASNGAEFTNGLTQFAVQERDRRIRELFGNRADQDRVRLAYDRVAEPVLNRAAEFEFRTRQKWRADTSETQLNNLSGLLATNATPEYYNQLSSEWDEFVTSSIGGNERVQSRYMQMGRQRLQRSMLEAAAARDPEGTVNRISSALASAPTSQGGEVSTNPLVREAITQADAVGVPREVMLGMGWIESRLNSGAGNPRRRDGSRMSSAAGGWQINDEMARQMGVQDRNDPRESTAAFAGFISGVRSKLIDRGIEPTPGTTYMFWNVGEPVANAIMRADPSERIENVVRRVYAQNKGLAFAEQVLANNPSMYRAGMTVGAVRANYEAKMQNAITATSTLTADKPPSSNEQARTIASGLIGIDATQLGGADLAEVLVKAQTAVGQTARSNQAQITGENFLRPDGPRADPYSTPDRNAVDAAVLARGTATNIAAGDNGAHLVARRTIEAAGFIPGPIVHAYREAINSPTANPGKVMTYRTLSSLQVQNPVAFDATKLPEDESTRVREFRMMTETMGMSEAQAISRIEFRRSPDGIARRKAMGDAFQGRESELKGRTWNELASGFDQPGTPFSSPRSVNDASQRIAVEAYRDAYTYWRERGQDQSDAVRLAQQDMKERWGVSNIAGGQNLMPFSPEKMLGENRKINGSFDWVTTQARDVISVDMTSRGNVRRALSGVETLGDLVRGRNRRPDPQAEQVAASVAEFRMVPTTETADDAAHGRIPRYRLMYRAPDGTMQDAGLFRPNYDGALARAEAEFIASSPARRDPPRPFSGNIIETFPEQRLRWGQRVPN